MMFTEPAHLLVLGLVLVGGWLLGLASRSGGAKWKARYAAERDAHAGYRREADTRASAAEARAAELERENTRLARATPTAPVAVTPATTTTTAATPIGLRAASAARPAYPADQKRGWFDWDRRP